MKAERVRWFVSDFRKALIESLPAQKECVPQHDLSRLADGTALLLICASSYFREAFKIVNPTSGLLGRYGPYHSTPLRAYEM